jgi:hypothetical protein
MKSLLIGRDQTCVFDEDGRSWCSENYRLLREFCKPSVWRAISERRIYADFARGEGPRIMPGSSSSSMERLNGVPPYGKALEQIGARIWFCMAQVKSWRVAKTDIADRRTLVLLTKTRRENLSRGLRCRQEIRIIRGPDGL